ncbi:MAG: universal stress protein [Euryarchaeota archaeon]|nr:universal stress protein [Euryarchaeota archaeon]MDE1835016.1 universal stress protein [Euryarchaeota archaeon]MDE1881337.1 universal stress protein [Euryarchaeota archaeon]MDE2044855.1 universal stress protein [Thermoplasmata archaeon]
MVPKEPSADPSVPSPTAPHTYSVPPRRILVGYEGDDRSGPAWHVALEIAQQHGSDLWVLHLIDLLHDAVARMNESERASMVRVNLERFQPLVAEGAEVGVRATLLVELGHPAERLAAKCSELKADLVVLGTTQHGALVNWLVEEVSAKVVPKVHVPVLLVPSHLARPKPHTSGQDGAVRRG